MALLLTRPAKHYCVSYNNSRLFTSGRTTRKKRGLRSTTTQDATSIWNTNGIYLRTTLVAICRPQACQIHIFWKASMVCVVSLPPITMLLIFLLWYRLWPGNVLQELIYITPFWLSRQTLVDVPLPYDIPNDQIRLLQHAWDMDNSTFTKCNGHLLPPRIPLIFFISGTFVELQQNFNKPITRKVEIDRTSLDYFTEVCPKSERHIISRRRRTQTQTSGAQYGRWFRQGHAES